ncbi:hypothetical protein SAMN05421749_101307 [Acinetobacter marinus]|uniref:UPF0246 protein SAMN05421749_101307 n=1 Tax=Acinetobacter marinus TaxID=281375 RepID=A0A1G6GRE6_9GAMM|nr:peroxide stress protein YaaA [Acinetobacter marinus]SDB84469.1 hypothetical protein SAMN05421749_101307 [Acinetobacter marinus]
MFIVISPAKSLDYESELPTEQFTQPRLLDDSARLIEEARKLSASQLGQLMHISEKLSQLNVDRFRDWQADFDLHNARQAIYAFTGDVYTGLDATSLDSAEIKFAQQHLRMLSGLYGLLRPLDLMMPYRLEMGTKLKNERGDNLYQFWGDRITERLRDDMQAEKSKILVNLASDEYYKSVNEKILDCEIIKPVFLDQKNGKYKVISFYAKKARGLMSRFIIQNKLKKIEQLKDFNVDGYYFDAENSNAQELVFKRDEQA